MPASFWQNSERRNFKCSLHAGKKRQEPYKTKWWGVRKKKAKFQQNKIRGENCKNPMEQKKKTAKEKTLKTG